MAIGIVPRLFRSMLERTFTYPTFGLRRLTLYLLVANVGLYTSPGTRMLIRQLANGNIGFVLLESFGSPSIHPCPTRLKVVYLHDRMQRRL